MVRRKTQYSEIPNTLISLWHFRELLLKLIIKGIFYKDINTVHNSYVYTKRERNANCLYLPSKIFFYLGHIVDD